MKMLLFVIFGLFFAAAGEPMAEDKFYSTLGKWVQVSNTNCAVWSSFPLEKESVTWSGGVTDGKAHGKGKLQWFTNSVPISSYDGELKKGLADGHGVAKSLTESCEGDWKQWRLTSTNVTISYLDGNRYTGEVKNGFKVGKGEETMAGGYRYVGQFKMDRFDGPGELILPNGDKIVGDWKGSQLDGVGTYTTKDGTSFKVRRTESGIQRL